MAGGIFGERGLLRDGGAATNARAVRRSETLVLPRAEFERLPAEEAAFRAFFGPGHREAQEIGPEAPVRDALTRTPLAEVMARDPLNVPPETTVAEAARLMTERRASCLLGTRDGRLAGIVTTRDLTARLVPPVWAEERRSAR